MDARTQDAVERLMRTSDFDILMGYISIRRQAYMEYLINYNPTDVGNIAKTQGQVEALREVLSIPEDAMALKAQRTNHE